MKGKFYILPSHILATKIFISVLFPVINGIPYACVFECTHWLKVLVAVCVRVCVCVCVATEEGGEHSSKRGGAEEERGGAETEIGGTEETERGGREEEETGGSGEGQEREEGFQDPADCCEGLSHQSVRVVRVCQLGFVWWKEEHFTIG